MAFSLSKILKRNTRAVATVAAGAASGASAGDIANQLLQQQRARLLPVPQGPGEVYGPPAPAATDSAASRYAVPIGLGALALYLFTKKQTGAGLAAAGGAVAWLYLSSKRGSSGGFF